MATDTTTPANNSFTSNSQGLDADDILQAANTIMGIRITEQVRLEKISKYMRGRHDPPYTPKGASTEYRWLLRRSKDNFLPLVCSVIQQNLHVDGFRPSSFDPNDVETGFDVEGDPGWSAWRYNRMTSRQHGIHRSVVKYGCAYAMVLPGRIASYDPSQGVTDKSMPVITPFSPRKMTALYTDDANDEWPVFAVIEQVINDNKAIGKARRVVTILDDTNRYILVGGVGTSPAKLSWPAQDDPILNGKPVVSAHGMGLCPVVRYSYEADLDSDSDCIGEIEPLISLQDQVNFHTFNEMLAEQYAAFKQRWISGMAPVDESGRGTPKFRPGVDRVWVSEDNGTKFGEFSETDLSKIIDAREATIRHMSTISQVPPYHLLGALVNLSADALSAARDGLDRKSDVLRGILTDSHRNLFRLCSKAQDDTDGWMDLFGSIIWRDTSARNFAATIDGLGKAAQMLGVPAAELWRRIPGVTAEDVAMWQASVSRADAMAQIDKVVQAALTGNQMAAPPDEAQPFQIGSVGAPPVMPPPAAPPGAPGAAAPPGSPGNQTGDVDANGNTKASNAPPSGPADSGTTLVHVPAHTRAQPNTPKPKAPPKPGSAV
jgi:hypothetical protein